MLLDYELFVYTGNLYGDAAVKFEKLISVKPAIVTKDTKTIIK